MAQLISRNRIHFNSEYSLVQFVHSSYFIFIKVLIRTINLIIHQYRSSIVLEPLLASLKKNIACIIENTIAKILLKNL